MKQSKELQRWEFAVDSWDDKHVWLKTVDLTEGEGRPWEEMEVPIGRFISMFGRDHLKEGAFGFMIIKQRADNKVVMRGWPYKRKWTQEEIAEVNARATEMWEKMKAAWERGREAWPNEPPPFTVEDVSRETHDAGSESQAAR